LVYELYLTKQITHYTQDNNVIRTFIERSDYAPLVVRFKDGVRFSKKNNNSFSNRNHIV